MNSKGKKKPKQDPEKELKAARKKIRELEGELKELSKADLSSKLLRTLVDYSPSVITIVNFQTGIFTEVNSTAEKLFGYSREEFLKLGPADISPEFQPNGRDSVSFAIEKITSALQGETPEFRWEHRHKDGTIIPCEIHLVKIPDSEYLVRGNIKDLRSEFATKALLQSGQEKFDLVIKSADLGLWDWNIEAGTLSPNERWATLLGYSFEEISPDFQFWKSLIHPDDLSETLNLLNFHLEGRSEIFDTDFRLRCKDGTYKWIRSRGKVWERDGNGKPIRALGIHLDINEAKETARILAEKERTLDLAIQGANLGVWDFNIVTQGHTVDENWIRMIGYEPGEINPTYEFWESSLHPQDRDKTFRLWNEYVQGKSESYSTMFRLRCKDGTYKWILTRGRIAARDTLGNPIRMIGIHMDVSEQKQIEEELRETKLFLDRAQKTAKVGSWEYDLHTGKVSASEELFHILETQKLGDPKAMDGIHPEDKSKVTDYFIKCIEEGIGGEIEYRTILPSGKEKTILNRTDFVKNEEGKVQKLLGTIQDVSLERDREKEERRKQKFELLVSSISTELINQPTLEIEEGIKNAVKKVTETFGMTRGSLILYDLESETRTMMFEYIDPEAKNRDPGWSGELPLDKENPVTKRILSGEIIATDQVPKMELEGYIRKLQERLGIQSIVSIPLSFEGKVIGLLNLASENSFDQIGINLGEFEFTCLRRIAEFLTSALERKRKHSELAAERDLLSGIMETSVAAITVLSPEGEILYANPSAEKVLGLSVGELTGRKYNAPEWKATAIDGSEWGPEDQPFIIVSSTGQSVYDVRHAIEDEKGNKKFLSINGAPIKESSGRIKYLVFLILDITESLLSEWALKENEERYRIVAEQTGQLVYDYDLSTGKITWAGAVEKITGYSFQEFQEVNAKLRNEFIHPEDRRKVTSALENAKNEGGYFSAEYRFLRKDGIYIIVEDKGVFVRNSDLENDRFLGAMADITERRKAQNDLIDSEERLRLALNASKMGTWSWNLLERTSHWSSDTVSIFGISVDNLQHDTKIFMDLVHPEDANLIRKSVRTSIRGKVNDIHLEYRVFHPDATIHWLEIKGKVFRTSRGMASRMAGTITDITDRKKSEEKLKASELRFQTFYRFANEAILFLNPRTEEILDTNPAFLSIFGFKQDEIDSISPHTLFTPNSWATLHARIRSLESSESLELQAVRKNGRVFPSIVSIHFYTEKDFQVAAVSLLDTSAIQEVEELKVINDEITVRNRLIEMQKNELQETLENLKKAQAQLIQSEKMAALGQLIAGVAHEINNPIGAIQASNQNLQDCLIRFQTTLPNVQSAIAEMGQEEVTSFRGFLDLVRQPKEQLAGMEERNTKKAIVSRLQELNIPSFYAVAEALTDMGFRELPSISVSFLKSENASLLLEYCSLESYFFVNTSTIQIAVDRVSKILYALKNFSHFNTDSEKIPASITENIETVLTIYQNQLKKGIRITKEYESIPKILCYPDDLIHIWTNLIYNSLQAMEFRGEIGIKTYKKGEFVAVEISDTGPGIPDSILDKIFLPFFTTKLPGEGSGLGLDIVKKVVDKHEGKIEVDSAPGATTFRILLPILSVGEN